MFSVGGGLQCLTLTPKSPPRPGVTRHGKPFDTCCRGCALGSGCPVSGPVECGDLAWHARNEHDSLCGRIDPSKAREGGGGDPSGCWQWFRNPGFIDSWFHMWQVGHVWHCCIWCCNFNTSILLCTFEYSIVWRYIFADELQNSAIVLS